MIFAFVLYPHIGLVPTAFMVAFLNAVVGILLLTRAKFVPESDKRQFRAMLVLAATMGLVLGFCLINATRISELVLQWYLPA